MSQNKDAKLKLNMDSLETKKATQKRIGTCANALFYRLSTSLKPKMTFYTHFKTLCYTHSYILANALKSKRIIDKTKVDEMLVADI